MPTGIVPRWVAGIYLVVLLWTLVRPTSMGRKGRAIALRQRRWLMRIGCRSRGLALLAVGIVAFVVLSVATLWSPS